MSETFSKLSHTILKEQLLNIIDTNTLVNVIKSCKNSNIKITGLILYTDEIITIYTIFYNNTLCINALDIDFKNIKYCYELYQSNSTHIHNDLYEISTLQLINTKDNAIIEHIRKFIYNICAKI